MHVSTYVTSLDSTLLRLQNLHFLAVHREAVGLGLEAPILEAFLLPNENSLQPETAQNGFKKMQA